MPASKVMNDEEWTELLDNAIRNLRQEIAQKIAECADEEVDRYRAEWRVLNKVCMAVQQELNNA